MPEAQQVEVTIPFGIKVRMQGVGTVTPPKVELTDNEKEND